MMVPHRRDSSMSRAIFYILLIPHAYDGCMYMPIRAGDISFYAAAAFMSGVFAANMGWNLWMLGTASFTAGAMLVLYTRISWKYAVFILFAAFAGALYYSAYVHWNAAHIRLPGGKHAAFFGVIKEEPKQAGNFIMLAVSLSRPYAGAVDIFTMPGITSFHYGDELWVNGSVDASKDPGASPAVFLPRLRVVAQHEGFWLREWLIDLKEAIIRKIVKMLPPDQAALLAGIMVGTTGTISAALRAQMEISGTTYIVNMFGYKIALITAALAAVLKDRLPRRWLLAVTLGVVALFVLASGAGVSAVRAAVMGSFAVIARGTGKVFSPRHAVAFAALGMVLADATLLTDAGFQLSFLSFIGIYYLADPVNNLFRWTDGGVLQWKEHAMLSLTTNLAILPVVINTFGEFSLTSFISNVLIMIPWLAVFAFGGLTTVLGSIFPPLAFCAVQVVGVLMQYELFVIHLFSIAAVPMPAVFGSPFAIAFYYGALIVFTYYYGAPAQNNN